MPSQKYLLNEKKPAPAFPRRLPLFQCLGRVVGGGDHNARALSVSPQGRADTHIYILSAVPAQKRGHSLPPLLGEGSITKRPGVIGVCVFVLLAGKEWLAAGCYETAGRSTYMQLSLLYMNRMYIETTSTWGNV